MLFLERISIFTVDDFRSKRKFAIMIITVAAASSRPGRTRSAWFCWPIPMILLYELGILMIVSGRSQADVSADLNWPQDRRAGSRTMTLERRPGKVYLVGAGPGDPGLLTRRGEALLARADVVVYDHLASARLLDLAPTDALRICAGKSVGHCTMTQDRIHEVLIEHARAGRSVVAAQGGRPTGLRARSRGGLVAGRGRRSLRDRPGGDRRRRRHGLCRHPGHASRGGLGRRIRDRSRRPRSRAGRRRLDWAALAGSRARS